MRVDILDEEVFNSVSPAALEKYLANSQWELVKLISGEVSIWSASSKDGHKHRVWLPLDQELSDYAASVGRLVRTIAEVEDKSQLQIVEDLETIAIGDIVRYKSYDQLNRSSSSLPLSEGLSLVRQAQDITTAAACTTVEKRPIISNRRPKEVVNYLSDLRLGQTERGSFSVKLISPLPSSNYKQLDLDSQTLQEVPFERQVVVTLMRSLSALQVVASEAHEKGRFYFEAFEELISQGVSANLCEAVTNTMDGRPRVRPLEVSVTWSYAITPPVIDLPSKVVFTIDILQYIARAANLFREHNPEQAIIRGYVTVLRRGKDEPTGTVTVLSVIEGRQRAVRITLTADNYNSAIQAHEGDFEVSCEGVLQRQGNLYFLDQPSNFHFIR